MQSKAQSSYKYPVEKLSFTDEFEIAYVDEGQKQAPVILMIHGLGGYVKHWYPTIDSLKDSYRCIALDLPGYGLSTVKPVTSTATLSFFAEAVDFLAKEISLEEVTLLGHSMGGQIAIMLAADKPAWLDNLVLAAPAGFETFSEEEANKIRAFSTQQAFMNQSEEQIRQAFAVNFVDQPDWVEEMIQDRLQARNQENFSEYCQIRSAAVEGMLNQPVRKKLSEIKVPTLVIYGEKDFLIPNRILHPDLSTSEVAKIGKTIPNATILMLPEAGHMLQVDQPKEFTNTIRNYLSNLKM